MSTSSRSRSRSPLYGNKRIRIHRQNLSANQDLIQETFNFSDRLALRSSGEHLYRLNGFVKDKEIEDLIDMVSKDLEVLDIDHYHERIISNKRELEDIKREYNKLLDFLERRLHPLRNYPSMTPKKFAQIKFKSKKRTKRTRKSTRKRTRKRKR